MGLIAATLGKGLVAANSAAAGAAALYAAHHGLAKGGLFLAAGVVMSGSSGRRAWTLPVAALLALSLAGLPPTGGMIAKLAIKEPLGDGVLGVLSILSAIASTMLMLHFIARLRNAPPCCEGRSGFGVTGPWLVVTIASLVVPAAYFVADTPTGLAPLLNYRLIWDFLWPVLAGAALAAASWRWLDRAPIMPEADIAVLGQRAAGEFGFSGVFVERAERLLRSWPVAAAMLLATATVLAGTGILAR